MTVIQERNRQACGDDYYCLLKFSDFGLFPDLKLLSPGGWVGGWGVIIKLILAQLIWLTPVAAWLGWTKLGNFRAWYYQTLSLLVLLKELKNLYVCKFLNWALALHDLQLSYCWKVMEWIKVQICQFRNNRQESISLFTCHHLNLLWV